MGRCGCFGNTILCIRKTSNIYIERERERLTLYNFSIDRQYLFDYPDCTSVKLITWIFAKIAQLAGTVEYTDCISAKGQDESLGYDIKPSDGDLENVNQLYLHQICDH